MMLLRVSILTMALAALGVAVLRASVALESFALLAAGILVALAAVTTGLHWRPDARPFEMRALWVRPVAWAMAVLLKS